jgi:dihydrofolate reductase
MKLILIAAMAKNRTIGKNNSIPWHIPEEVQFFKKSTMGHAVIMGRKTYDSIAMPLPGRINVVLSRSTNLDIPGCHTANSLEEGIACCSNQEKIFIIGGRTLYKKSLNLADTILLTILDDEYEGDTFFPQIPEKTFKLVSTKRMGTKEAFTVYTYQRKNKDSVNEKS